MMEQTILTDSHFESWGFRRDGEYWCKSHIDCDYCFKFADFRNDWGFYMEYTDPIDPRDIGMKHFISCGLTKVDEVRTLWNLLTQEKLLFRPKITNIYEIHALRVHRGEISISEYIAICFPERTLPDHHWMHLPKYK